jgi:hypothetical protein
MPGTQGYAVVSCHVERPLDDRVWRHYHALLARRPGGFAIASLMRPPAAGESAETFVERARAASALGHPAGPRAARSRYRLKVRSSRGLSTWHDTTA